MIDPALPPACYTDASWFDLEQEKIFKKLWLFVGLEQQLREENDFIARDFSGTPVLVQKIDGQLRAFRNACAHRGMPLQVQPCGNRKLICPYHGWSFRANGQLRGIPNENIYNICKSKKENISLEKYAVCAIGSFIFVNLSPSPLPIEEQLSEDMQTVLREFSKYFAPEISYSSFPGNYNWKLNFENILDWNHAQFVHTQTLAPLLAFEKNGSFSTALPDHSLIFAPGTPLAQVRFSGNTPLEGKIALKDISRIGRSSMPYTRRWFADLLEQPIDPGAFSACNIFPNMNFGSIHGEHFFIQQYVPVSPGQVEYHSWVLTAKLKKNLPAQPHLLWGIHHAEKKVIDEDILLFHAQQKTLSTASHMGTMGDHEASLAAVGLWYMQNLQD